MVHEIHRYGNLQKVATFSFIAMIPKCNNPQSLSEYKPISHIESTNNIISKLLASRMKNVLPQYLPNPQTPSYL